MSDIRWRCHHCGTLMPDGANYCPHCGAGGGSVRQAPSVWRVLLAVFIGLVSLPIGAFGGCFLLFGTLAGGDATLMALALGALAVAGLGVFGMIKLLR